MRANQSVRNRPFPRPTLSADGGQADTNSLFAPGAHQPSDREAAILWVRMQMVRNGISFDDLVQAHCFDIVALKRAARYRSADGRTWDGQGELPDWLQRAVNAGQSIEHFQVG